MHDKMMWFNLLQPLPLSICGDGEQGLQEGVQVDVLVGEGSVGAALTGCASIARMPRGAKRTEESRLGGALHDDCDY